MVTVAIGNRHNRNVRIALGGNFIGRHGDGFTAAQVVQIELDVVTAFIAGVRAVVCCDPRNFAGQVDVGDAFDQIEVGVEIRAVGIAVAVTELRVERHQVQGFETVDEGVCNRDHFSNCVVCGDFNIGFDVVGCECELATFGISAEA